MVTNWRRQSIRAPKLVKSLLHAGGKYFSLEVEGAESGTCSGHTNQHRRTIRDSPVLSIGKAVDLFERNADRVKDLPLVLRLDCLRGHLALLGVELGRVLLPPLRRRGGRLRILVWFFLVALEVLAEHLDFPGQLVCGCLDWEAWVKLAGVEREGEKKKKHVSLYQDHGYEHVPVQW